jgi:hypothetical protein
LSNWESGRLLTRSAILSGDGVFTIRSNMTQVDLGVKSCDRRFQRPSDYDGRWKET